MSVFSVLEMVSRTFGLAQSATVTDAYTKQLNAIANQRGCTEAQAHQLLLGDTEMRDRLAGRLTTPETYFLRIPADFEAFKAHYLSHLGRTPAGSPGPLYQVLSVGCSTGEEPYSMAMVLQQHFPARTIENVTINACDISNDAIETAKRGVYGRWSMRGISEEILERYFEHDRKTSRWSIASELKKRVQFTVSSAQRMLAEMPPNSVNVVFFRNVNIYLLPDATQRIYQRIHEVLVPGGVLIVAPTDVQPPKDLFSSGARSNVYRPHTAEEHRAPVPRISKPSKPPLLVRQKKAAPSFLPEVSTPTQRAAATMDEQLALGLRHLEENQPMEAEAIFRRALFENGTHVTVRFWYAVSLSQNGHSQRATTQLNALLSQLQNKPAEQILTDWDITVAELLQVSRNLKEQLQ